MKSICKSMCFFLFAFFVIFSGVISANEKPPSSLDIRELKQDYDNRTGETGKLIAYIPIKKPCLNILLGDEHKEFCFIDSTTEDLSQSDKAGFYITLTNLSNERVSFEYHTLWYSKKCKYYIYKEKPTCDQPYTN